MTRFEMAELDLYVALGKTAGSGIPAYLAYSLNGNNTVRDLVNTIAKHYKLNKQYRNLLYKIARYRLKVKLNTSLSNFGFPVPC